MKKQILMIALVLTFGIISISLAQEHDHSKMEMDHDIQKTTSYQVDVKFQEQLNSVYQASLNLSKSLMTEEITEIKKVAYSIKDQIEKVDMILLKGQEHVDWMNYSKTMNSGLDKITSVTSIADQRSAFSEYNTGLYLSIKAFGVGEEVFYQFCPMANSSDGAYWLSNSKEIHNPYLGEKMATCGTVKETLN